MPSNSKGTAKNKRKHTGKSAVNKAKRQKAKEIKKRKKKKLSPEEKAAAASQAMSEIEKNKEEGNTVTTAVVPIPLMTKEELEQITRDNSLLLNPILANASIQKDFQCANNRLKDLQELHNYLFDPANQATFEEKTLVSLYNIGIQDFHKTMGAKLKIAELSDKARILRDAYKYYNEQDKEREIAGEDTSHTSAIIQALLDESMRHALADELKKKWGGSNSYRPPENTDYEVLAVDPEAEE